MNDSNDYLIIRYDSSLNSYYIKNTNLEKSISVEIFLEFSSGSIYEPNTDEPLNVVFLKPNTEIKIGVVFSKSPPLTYYRYSINKSEYIPS